MTSVADEQTILTEPSSTSVRPSILKIQARFGEFFTDCTVAGVSLLASIGSIAAHISATAAHGATGAVVGTTNTQTLQNKTIDTAANTLTVTGGPYAGANINTALNHAYGVLSSNGFNAVATVIPGVVPILGIAVVGATVLGANSQFTSPSDGILQCGKTSVYHISYSLNLEGGGAGVLYTVRLGINNTLGAAAFMTTSVPRTDAGGFCTANGTGILALNTGDQLGLFLTAVPGSPIVASYSIVATELI